MLDFKPFVNAKLGPLDLSRLLTVHRVTASGWLNGHTQPHYLLTPRVQALLDTVQLALKAGDLPVPFSVRRRERGLYIETVLARAVLHAALAE